MRFMTSLVIGVSTFGWAMQFEESSLAGTPHAIRTLARSVSPARGTPVLKIDQSNYCQGKQEFWGYCYSFCLNQAVSYSQPTEQDLSRQKTTKLLHIVINNRLQKKLITIEQRDLHKQSSPGSTDDSRIDDIFTVIERATVHAAVILNEKDRLERQWQHTSSDHHQKNALLQYQIKNFTNECKDILKAAANILCNYYTS